MKAKGVSVQICLSSTIGHFDDWQIEQPWPKMVGAEAAHKVDPNVALGFMVANLDVQAYCPPDLQEWIRLGRNAKGEVWLRPGSGFYDDFSPYGVLKKNIAIGRLVAATEGEGVINVTEEVTSPCIRRGKSMRITYLEAALNVGMAGADGTTYDAIKPNLDEQLKDNAVVAEMARRYPALDAMYRLVRGKRQVGVAVPDDRGNLWQLFCLGVPFTFRPASAWTTVPDDLFGGEVMAFARGEEIKAALTKRCDGKLASRVDSALRVGQSLWESSDRRERAVFVWNFDYDAATDAVLTEDRAFAAEILQDDGTWKPLGKGDSFRLPPLEPWSATVIRLF